MNVGDALNKVAERIAPEIVNLDRELVRGPLYNSWLASRLGEQNPYRSNFVLNICQVIAIKEAVLQGGRHIVLVDDWKFGTALIQALRDNSIQASWYGRTRKKSGYLLFKIIQALLSALKYTTNQVSAGKKWRHRYSDNTNDIYLLSWVKADSFLSNEPRKMDAAFGILPQWISDLGKKPQWIGNPLSSINSLSSIVANTSAAYDFVVPIQALLKYKDIWQAIAGWIFFPFAVKTNLNIENCKLSSVVKYYIRKELSGSQVVQSRFLINIAKNMKERQITPRVLIYTFENQPWEKILVSSFRRYLPDTKLIGVQHAPFSSQYLSLYPSKRQWQEGTTPDLLVTIGLNTQQQFIKYGAPADRVVVGGSLRMPYLAENKTNAFNHSAEESKRILVTCPLEINQATELAFKVVCATQELTNIEVIINFHPLSSPNLIKSVKNSVCHLTGHNHIKFSDQPVLFWLKKINLLLYNSSATVFDALNKGIPVLYIGPLNGLDLDKLPRKESVIIRTIEDTQIEIEKIIMLPRAATELVKSEQKNLKEYFTTPDQSIWKMLLGHTKFEFPV
jgi:hypothetical protein